MRWRSRSGCRSPDPGRHGHRPAALLIALAFVATSAFSLATPSATLAWTAGTANSASEKRLVALTNQSRAAAGLKALKVDSKLTSVARWRSKDMIQRDYFSHDIPGYGKVYKKLDAVGYCYKVAGENIGWNTYPDAEATAQIHQMFMGSSGHRANILGKSWDVIGVGVVQGRRRQEDVDRSLCRQVRNDRQSHPEADRQAQAGRDPQAETDHARRRPRSRRRNPRPADPTPTPTPIPTPVPTPEPRDPTPDPATRSPRRAPTRRRRRSRNAPIRASGSRTARPARA